MTPGKRSAILEIKQVGATWQTAKVTKVTRENARAKTFWLELAERLPTYAGQHLEVRLTSPDGYQATRSYSIASSPLEVGLAISVQMIEDGEVSGYLDTYVKAGDELEIHYPIGYHFVWSESSTDPVLLIAGGSGIVPLAAMLKHHQLSRATSPMRLLYSARSIEDMFYKDWLMAPDTSTNGREVHLALTDKQPSGWDGFSRRVDAEMLEAVTAGLDVAKLQIYVCGPTPMVEAAGTQALRTLGVDALRIKTERFGPTGLNTLPA